MRPAVSLLVGALVFSGPVLAQERDIQRALMQRQQRYTPTLLP